MFMLLVAAYLTIVPCVQCCCIPDEWESDVDMHLGVLDNGTGIAADVS